MDAYKKVPYNWSIAFRLVSQDYAEMLEEFDRNHIPAIDDKRRFHR